MRLPMYRPRAALGFVGYAGVLLAGLLAGIASGCANPVAPSGGPGNTEPALLAESQPADSETNVARDVEIELQFDKYLNRGSMSQAFSLTPEPERPPEFDFSGRAVTVSFPEPLRDSTTYIVSLSTDLRTERGSVNLDAPITFAFSTGPRIDQGALSGRVVEPQRGEPQQGVDIFAYALPPDAPAPPDTLPDAPDFRTQTDSDGQFSFQNIREEPYYVIAVRDNNRNRAPDANEAYAVPPVPRLDAVEDAPELDVPWLLTEPRPDSPRAERVRPRTIQRQTVRFSQPILWQDRTPSTWVLVDSTAQDTIDVETVYTSHDTPYEVAVVAEQALRAETVHRLTVPPQALADSLGRAVPDTTLRFTPSTTEHDDAIDLIGFRPNRSGGEAGRPLMGSEAPMLRTTRPPDDSAWNESITATDTTGTPRTIVPESQDGLRHRLTFEPALTPEMPVDVRIAEAVFANEDTVRTQRYRRLARDEVGEIEVPITYERRPWNPTDTTDTDPAAASSFEPVTLGRALPDSLLNALPPLPSETTIADSVATPIGDVAETAASTLPGVLVIEMHDTSENQWPTRHVRTDTTGTVRFERVPQGQYRFRLWRDRENTGRWSPGQLAPYRPADPIVWSESTVEGRARWTNVLETPLPLLELTTD